MRIACPSCAATYEVPGFRLRPGKVVRCAQCGSEWSPVHEADEIVVPPEPVAPRPSEAALDVAAPISGFTAMDRLSALPASRPSRSGLVTAWVLTVVVLAGGIAAMIGWREAVIRAWPPSARLLATNGQMPEHARTAEKKTE
jgi:predicted Zn finger-like uncharacterized protein